MPTMVSVVEDAPVHVLRSDTRIPVEENAINEDETSVPGGSAQTRDYYSDSLEGKAWTGPTRFAGSTS
jgi:hypothetical protein